MTTAYKVLMVRYGVRKFGFKEIPFGVALQLLRRPLSHPVDLSEERLDQMRVKFMDFLHGGMIRGRVGK
ncbi:MAG: hypothetical protein COU64_02005 [Candidatus Pacebacteria bacterium CG10_big_fil_rev_8_21_14_0_10_40_26]|nr:MAG: hypothetical protein COU64_02005 [Candidatus Pacebacteria bacterium CG10_big_fil_rev_8_21_14_0_10_40_26]